MWNKLTTGCDLLSIVREADDLAGPLHTPFSSIAQLNQLCQKAGKSAPKLHWLFASILDSTRCKVLRQAEINLTVLHDKGKVNIVDIFLSKQGLLHELLGPALTSFKFMPSLQHKLRTIYQSHSSVRDAFGFKTNDDADKGAQGLWRSNLSKTEELFCCLVDGSIYGSVFDSTIRQCIKLCKAHLCWKFLKGWC